jgi:hypothetical protein
MKDVKPAKMPMGTNGHLNLDKGGKSVDAKPAKTPMGTDGDLEF